MNSTNWAWAAGLFEGEGCISLSKVNSVYLTLAMTDRDVVDRFHAVMGVGNIYVEHRSKSNRRDMHYWRVAKANDVERILIQLRPFFGERRTRKTDAALERLSHCQRPGFCMRGHPMKGDNLYVAPGGQRSCRPCRKLRRPKKTPFTSD